MNSQTILDRNNQNVNIDLICYFSSNNKKYIFYSKNETVQDGLIKMYVSEENAGLTNDITQDQWTSLKKIMQGIITGSTNGIEFLSYSNPVKFNEPKAIALNEANINVIKSVYKNSVGTNLGNEPVLNKDILSQSFGANMETSVSTPEPVQISSIPNVQNNFNMESTPVNLNINSVNEEQSTLSVPNIEPISVEPVIPTIESSPVIETVQPELNNTNEISVNEGALNINSIKPAGIDSGFKVSNEPNIFDNPQMPYQITEEEINSSDLSETSTSSLVQEEPVNKTVNNDNSLNNKKIELNNRKIKLFEELASIYKEENELLKDGSGNYEESLLEKTASNLFNNNGTLNENEVLR